MSTKVLGRFSKGETIKYISHLDFSATIHRFVRMSGLKIAFTQGYNPKAKISFLTAVSTGIAFEQDPVLFHFNILVHPEDVLKRLSTVLPSDIELKSARIYHGKKMPRVTKSTYVIKSPREILAERIQTFNQLPEINILDRKGREIDIKRSISEVVPKENSEITYTAQHVENSVLPSPLDVMSFLLDERFLNTSGLKIVITHRELTGSIEY